MDALLRSAVAEVADRSAGDVPAAEPRRAPLSSDAHITTALPLRMAQTLRQSAPRLAEAAAAHLRTCPQVDGAWVERGGFIGIRIGAEARAGMVGRAAIDGTAFLCGYFDTSRVDDAAEDSTASGARSGASALHDAPTLEAARNWAREDARRRMRAAACAAAAAGRDGTPLCGTDTAAPTGCVPESDLPYRRTSEPAALGGCAVPEREHTSWRDPYLDRWPGDTPASRLLAVIGEASARIAFCRAATERPRPGEETGPGLPAVPSAEHPGAWALAVEANPAFAVRYAHAHAVSTLRWVSETRSAGTQLDNRGIADEEPPGEGASDAASPGPAAAQVECGERTLAPGRKSRTEPGGHPPLPAPHEAAARQPARRPLSGSTPGTSGRAAGARPGTGAPLHAPATDALAAALFDGPLILRAAQRSSEPHMLVRYLEVLATAYHEWWESGGGFTAETTGEPGGAEPATPVERLQMCAAVAGVLRAGLFLLGVPAPTRL